ncbi:hypothetical protein O1L60_03395 [Streptomyces diastatochromogenes]|nr:hypothetical protein [Streptomyces diastatochromogenes]
MSGPDGADGASLVRGLTALLGERGVTVVTVHGHGCFLCRRFPVPPRARTRANRVGRWARRATDPERQGSRLHRAHALLHAGELAARLTAAALLARTRARGRSRTHGGQAVVVTDRGPWTVWWPSTRRCPRAPRPPSGWSTAATA